MKTTNNTPRTIKATIAAIIADFPCSGFGQGFNSIDGLREPEIAAKLNLDTELTYKAIAKMTKLGYVMYESTGRLGCVGYFRTTKGIVAFQSGPEEAADLDDMHCFDLLAG